MRRANKIFSGVFAFMALIALIGFISGKNWMFFEFLIAMFIAALFYAESEKSKSHAK